MSVCTPAGASVTIRAMVTTRIKVGNEKRIAELREMIERDPLNVNLRFQLAASLEAAGKLQDATKTLAEAIDKARRNLGVAHCSFAVMQMKVGKPEDALKNFDIAIEIDPSNASFYLSNKAHALTQIGLHEKAKAIYEQILTRKDASKETQRIVIRNLGEFKK